MIIKPSALLLAIAAALSVGMNAAAQECDTHCPANRRDNKGCCLPRAKPKAGAPASATKPKGATAASAKPLPKAHAKAKPPLQSAAAVVVSAPQPEPVAAAPSAPATPEPTGAKPGDFINYADLDREPIQKSKPDPVIPGSAGNRKLHGLISVTITISERGEVENAVLLHGLTPDYGLNAACVDAARKMRFSSPIKDGVPVKTKKTVTYTFAD